MIASFGGYKHAVAGEVAVVREFAGILGIHARRGHLHGSRPPYWGGAALVDRRAGWSAAGPLYVEHSLDGGETVPGNRSCRSTCWRRSGATWCAPAGLRAARPWLGVYVSEADDRLVVTGVAANAPATSAACSRAT